MTEKHWDALRALSERIVSAQQPIRILDAVQWDDSVREAFFAGGTRRPPPVGPDYYRARPLPFAVAELRQTFEAIIRDVETVLGADNPAGRLMHRNCREYLRVIDLLEARGTPAFAEISRELYGGSSDPLHEGGPSLADLADLMGDALRNVDESAFFEADRRDLSATQAVAFLQERLNRVFSHPDARVHVCESDGIVADAAAGSDYIKLRRGTVFSERELRGLEAHEGWVHVGTTLNGRLQPVCTFLSKGTPSTTITQEGLALLVEVISLSSYPVRLRRVTDRIHAIRMAEEGAGFVEVFDRLREEGRSADEAYTVAVRVFRGSTPDGGPFTKDLSYSKGFVQCYNFVRLAVRRGRLDRIPLLFCGKLAIEEMGTIARLVDMGLVLPPRYLPPPVEDLKALTAWMAYSNFLNQIDLARVNAEFEPLLS
ncbi:MAG: flavohemoglobin expression-modulating QEGLA motif protein [Gammaproteobacteria bacterium]|nr:flavohemoglobin expression-modulating QEGLA motif protein [Gammaproteobacteria bacterium]